MNKEIIIEKGQTMFDIAVMHYGSVEGLFLLMDDNAIDSVNYNLQVGEKLKIKSEAIDQSVVDYYKKEDIVVNSGFDVVTSRAFSSGFSIGFS